MLQQAVRAARVAADPCALLEPLHTPYPWQAQMLRRCSSSSFLFNAGREMILSPRQASKSTSAACLALYVATQLGDPHLPNGGNTVLIVSPNQRSSSIMIQRIREIAAAQTPPIRWDAESRTYLHYGYSQIHSLGPTPSGLRGWSARLAIVDEMAAIDSATMGLATEVMGALTPTTAGTKGAILALTTSDVEGSLAHQIWTAEEEDTPWTRTLVTIEDVSTLTPQYLEQERRTLLPHKFEAEYMCKWINQDGSRSLFDPKAIDRMMQRSESLDTPTLVDPDEAAALMDFMNSRR